MKDGKLYIGSHGSLRDLEYVKEITDKGEVRTLDWADNYHKLAIACGITRPGQPLLIITYCLAHSLFSIGSFKLSYDGLLFLPILSSRIHQP